MIKHIFETVLEVEKVTNKHGEVDFKSCILYDDVMKYEDSIFPDMTRAKIFKWLQKEHGRCTSKVYIGNGIPVGWVFQKRVEYTDCNETYLQETWISFGTKEVETTITYELP